ncbi:MAG: hydantoinase B/oxoprolinase family protein, partial [Anaerolineales bacterium]
LRMDAAQLEVFKHLFAAVGEEMGVALRRSAFSPNIKERLDFSCAVFDSAGRMASQAAHIPVHLGAMPEAVRRCLESIDLGPGDAALLNDPYRGGTHLPDITVVSPVFVDSDRLGFVANRAHHADVGGMAPGSMPLAQEVFQEGLILPPVRLVKGGVVDEDLMHMILANVRTPVERRGDLHAQVAANRRGVERLHALAGRYGADGLTAAMNALMAYAERMTRRLLAALPAGTYRFEDQMDDDGFEPQPAVIRATVTLAGEEATVDFEGTSPQRRGGINAVMPITTAAVSYVFRCLVGLDIPSNSGCLAPIRILAPPGSLVNPRPPASVAAGNVETSQRIVDVVFGALAQACPDRVPAASQGTMNNLTIGGWDPARGRAFAYYETLGGGMGARPGKDGASAIHSHMTNTLNTPVEALEFAYPLRVREYSVRRGSGGAGHWRGGDGAVREIELLAEARVTILSDRRRSAPYGLSGGGAGKSGRNLLIRGESITELESKVTLAAKAGDRIRVETPGGGGMGE